MSMEVSIVRDSSRGEGTTVLLDRALIPVLQSYDGDK